MTLSVPPLARFQISHDEAMKREAEKAREVSEAEREASEKAERERTKEKERERLLGSGAGAAAAPSIALGVLAGVVALARL